MKGRNGKPYGDGRKRMKAIRRELDSWPKGPASGFEKIGDIAKRLIADVQKGRKK